MKCKKKLTFETKISIFRFNQKSLKDLLKNGINSKESSRIFNYFRRIYIGLHPHISCNNNSQKRSKLGINSNTKRDNSRRINLQTAQIISKDSLGIYFIGKTTQELNKYNFHVCFERMIEEYSENEKYAVSAYFLKVGNCRNGKSKITIEHFINYYDEVKANFVIKDELIVLSSYLKKMLFNNYFKIRK
jgi:hypothetical protein